MHYTHFTESLLSSLQFFRPFSKEKSCGKEEKDGFAFACLQVESVSEQVVCIFELMHATPDCQVGWKGPSKENKKGFFIISSRVVVLKWHQGSTFDCSCYPFLTSFFWEWKRSICSFQSIALERQFEEKLFRLHKSTNSATAFQFQI